jgi:putative nucleotidyltransferase with HDIG domain
MRTSVDGVRTRGISSANGKASIPLLGDSITEAGASSRASADWVLSAYGAFLSLAALTLAISLLSIGYRPESLLTTVVMAVAALLSEKQTVRVTENIEVSVGFLAGLFAAVALGPISAMIVAVASLCGDFGRPFTRWLIWVGGRSVGIGAGALVAAIVLQDASLGGLFVATAFASLIVIGSDSTIGAITLSLRKGGKFYAHLPDLVRVLLISVLVYIPVITGLAYVYKTVSPWAVLLFIGPAIAAQRFFVLYKDQIRTAGELTQAVERLESVNLSFATALVTALDARDHYTAGHSATVAVYARDIAREIDLSEDKQKQAHLCGLLHDIGKIGVPTGLLEKEGPLAPSERSTIEMHAEVGATILCRVEDYAEIAQAVRHHHERFDGLGYPERLEGDAIPILARIVAVADSYSAMTSKRPYRDALSYAVARDRLEQAAGNQLDPEMVAIFTNLLDRASYAYVAGTDANFEIEAGELISFEPAPALSATG